MISPPLIRISEPGAHWLLSFSKKRLQRRNIVFILTPVRYPPALLVDISEFGLNSKIKKFSYSFICGKGYSPPEGGENSFLSTVWSSLFEGAGTAQP